MPGQITPVRLVIADTGPINYLILIGHIDLLPRLFDRVALPSAVQSELSKSRAPLPVKSWIAVPPLWLEIHDTTGLPQVSGLHEGETAAIALAKFLHADIVLIDERKGVSVARSQGLRVTGTLGLLDMAAQEGLVDFVEAAERLRNTTFRHPEHLLTAMLEKHRSKGRGNV